MGSRQIKFLLAYCILAFALENSDAFAQSLLKGATPSNFSVPSGWKVYATQNFESGSLNSSLGEFIWGSISTAKPHSGAQSSGGVINGRQPPGWGFESFPSREFYLSWWEWVDSNARFNTEFAEFQILHNTGTFQESWWTWYYTGTFNDTQARMSFVSNGPQDFAFGPTAQVVPTGAWHQYEVHFKANTPGGSDGQSQIYLDGNLLKTIGPQSLDDGVDMSGSRVSIGGTYTKLIWRRADGSCGTFEGDGTTPPPTVCYDFNNCPCPPNPPIFNRYFDDIIVLVPGSGGGGVNLDNPPGPPPVPTGLAAR